MSTELGLSGWQGNFRFHVWAEAYGNFIMIDWQKDSNLCPGGRVAKKQSLNAWMDCVQPEIWVLTLRFLVWAADHKVNL